MLKRIVVFLVLTLLIHAGLCSDENTDLLIKKPQGVRAAGMANAFVAIDGEPLGLYWNPAGISTINDMMLSSSYSDQLELDIKNNYLDRNINKNK